MKLISLETGDFEVQNGASFYWFRSLFKRNIKLKLKIAFFRREKIKLDIIIERGAKSTKCSTVL